jgi:hypothetical protein
VLELTGLEGGLMGQWWDGHFVQFYSKNCKAVERGVAKLLIQWGAQFYSYF